MFCNKRDLIKKSIIKMASHIDPARDICENAFKII